MEYNTKRPGMAIRAYGRNVNKLIDHVKTIEDKEERSKAAAYLVRVMGQLNPQQKDASDYQHKLWDHLFALANYDLDIESPFEKPDPEALAKKPDRLQYPTRKIRYKHYGSMVEKLIQKALEQSDAKEQKAMAGVIANLMKRLYLNWNRDSVNDNLILQHLQELSNGVLTVPDDFKFEETQDIIARNNTKKKRKGNFKGNRNKKKHQNY